MWLQITAGRGPEECAWAVAQAVARMRREAAEAGLRLEVLDAEPSAHGLHSALVALDGPAAAAFAGRWTGTVLWIGRSPFRPHHRRKNWFIGIAALSPPEEGRADLCDADLRFETMRAGGPGGQHVNTTDSAVRLTHLPTGITVTAREERSQHRNRTLALARLADRLAEQRDRAAGAARQEAWAGHNSLVRGNPVRTFQGEGFQPTG